MNVIGARRNRMKLPSTMPAHLANRFLDDGSLSSIKVNWQSFQSHKFCLLADDVGGQQFGAGNVMIAIDRTARCAVKPATVGVEGDKVGEAVGVATGISAY